MLLPARWSISLITGHASSPTTVKVFSNCDQVKLYLNNVLIATQYPDTDVNSTHLPHPPFTFTGLAFQSGTLKAEGLIGGQVVATHIVTTPGTATALSVAFDFNVNDVLPANGSETIAVNASIVDSSGTLVPTASSYLRKLLGDGAGSLWQARQLLGPKPESPPVI